jgi:hypothetical protein
VIKRKEKERGPNCKARLNRSVGATMSEEGKKNSSRTVKGGRYAPSLANPGCGGCA